MEFIELIKYYPSSSVEFSFRNPSEQRNARLLVQSLENIDYDNAIKSFTSNYTDSLISLSVFLNWMKSLGVKDSIMPALTEYFTQFDSHGNMIGDTIEVLGGLLCFSQGSKSHKLSIIFSLLDESGEGFLSRRALWRIFRSVLRGMTLFCEFNVSVEEVSVLSASKIFKYYGVSKYITLEDLSDWYLFCGNEISFWIELLDFKKWIYSS